MSDNEAPGYSSASSGPDDGLPDNKALPWPDTAVELACKLTAATRLETHEVFSENELPSSPTVPRGNNNYVSDNALPWQPSADPPKEPRKEINILLLGESGVGKSTFINSFANYMKHEDFGAVQSNQLSVLIPARFHIFDKDFQKHLIEIGANDKNEHLSDGEAATQNVQTYVFYVTIEGKPYTIRFIDTPGMGDPRGIDQDNKNCDYVLNYLGRLEKVHAICLLLRPTNNRLDVFLDYCITQILSRLEKSATDNIAFLFTNTRGQNYTPGETYTSLELLVKKIKDTNNVCLPLSKSNVFCFDNEAFRFLAAVKQDVEFQDGILEANIQSWRYSYKEVYRLLSYIVELKPHDPKKTISINHARKMVLQLAQPLAEIVQLIGDNIYELDQHTHQLLMENQTLDELKLKLHMPVIDIRVMELKQPVTICTAPKCSAIYKVAGKNKFHYKQRCHNPCYLNNVPAEIVGDPHILGCWAITRSTQTCHQCNCRFNTHMHIYYETETFENKIVDENVLKNINNKEDAAKEKQRVINKVLNHKGELEEEHKYIIKCSAAFAHFLQQKAITPVNDSLKEYVKYLITREENLGPNSNKATLDYLRRLLSEYEQEKNVLEEALKYDTATNGVLIDTSAHEIEKKIRDLFTLRHFGMKIKQLYNLHQSGGIIEHKQSEFVVKEHYNLSIFDTVKSYYKRGKLYLGLGKASIEDTKYNNYSRSQMEMQPRYHDTMPPRMYSNMRGYPHGQTDEFRYRPHRNSNPNERDYYSFEEERAQFYEHHVSEQQMRQFYEWSRNQRGTGRPFESRRTGYSLENDKERSYQNQDDYKGKNNNGALNKGTNGKNQPNKKKQQKSIEFSGNAQSHYYENNYDRGREQDASRFTHETDDSDTTGSNGEKSNLRGGKGKGKKNNKKNKKNK